MCRPQRLLASSEIFLQGYQGSHHLIRHIMFDNSSGALVQLPLPEYAGLIHHSLYAGSVSFDNASTISLLLAGLPQPVDAQVSRWS